MLNLAIGFVCSFLTIFILAAIGYAAKPAVAH